MSSSLAELKASWQSVDGELRQVLDHTQAWGRKIETCLSELEAEKGKLDEQHRQLQEESASIRKREDELKQGEVKLEEEKRAMMKLGADKNDLLTLNFGGEKVVTVKRSLLLQFEGSMLAAMFSGRHEDHLDKDKNGNIFLDFSPNIMMPLIEYLRLFRDAPPEETVQMPDIQASDRKAWDKMLLFFGLRDYIITATTFKGVQRNVNIGNLEGWTLFFCQPYRHKTTLDDFKPPVKHSGNTLLVGARKSGAETLEVAAMGLTSIVTERRDDQSTRFHNGVYWYCSLADDHQSVGFAPNSTISLRSADTEGSDGQFRLSWHLCNHGGHRAGGAEYLHESTEWEKVIFIGTTNLGICGETSLYSDCSPPK